MTVSTAVGRMRDRVEIQEGTRTRLGQGSQLDTFSRVAERWASIVERPDDKFIVEIRYYQGLIPTAKNVLDSAGNKILVNRLKHGTRILNIEDVLDKDAQKTVLRLICTRDDQTF